MEWSMHKIILRSLGYCLLMSAATISQMIAPPIALGDAAAASADAHDASRLNVAEAGKGDALYMMSGVSAESMTLTPLRIQ
jgi:hypothetical protein